MGRVARRIAPLRRHLAHVPFIAERLSCPVERGRRRFAEAGAKPLQPPREAVPLIKRAIALVESDDAWVPLGAVGSQLYKLATDFDTRTFGFPKLIDLVRETNAFEIEKREGGTVRIRVKPTPARQASRQPRSS